MQETKCILVWSIFKSGGSKTETRNHKHEYSANAYTQPTHFAQPFQTIIVLLKSKLQEIIETEDKRKPLTDAQLSELLGQEDYHIARRTVAKYREQLKIPVARLRRTL